MRGSDRELYNLDGACRTTRLMSERLASDIIECDGLLVIKLYSRSVPRDIVEEEVRLTNLARDCGIRAPRVRELVGDGGRWGQRREISLADGIVVSGLRRGLFLPGRGAVVGLRRPVVVLGFLRLFRHFAARNHTPPGRPGVPHSSRKAAFLR